MSYEEWLNSHTKKHKKIVQKLVHLSDDELIEYFRFENMIKNEPNFCPLYKDNKKCHDIEDLNCYLCACPNFRVTNTKSYCNIQSNEGSQIVSNDGFIHQDCSKCTVPHQESYIKNKFHRDLEYIFKDCIE
jgi:Zn-finger protein